jgi:hypothetical protein
VIVNHIHFQITVEISESESGNGSAVVLLAPLALFFAT